MAVSVVGGPQRHRGGSGNVSRQTLTQSTATADQSINLYVDQVTLGVGTATGFNRNRYTLASGAEEGREITLFTTGTGEANVFLAGGTATGRIVMAHADDMLRVKYELGRWWIVTCTPDSGALGVGTFKVPTASST